MTIVLPLLWFYSSLWEVLTLNSVQQAPERWWGMHGLGEGVGVTPSYWLLTGMGSLVVGDRIRNGNGEGMCEWFPELCEYMKYLSKYIEYEYQYVDYL